MIIKYNSINLLTLAKLDSMIRFNHKKACNIDLNLKKMKKDIEPSYSSTNDDSIKVTWWFNWSSRDSVILPTTPGLRIKIH